MVVLNSFIRGGTANIYKGYLPRTVCTGQQLTDSNYVLVLADGAQPVPRNNLQSCKLALEAVSAAAAHADEVTAVDAGGESIHAFAAALDSLCSDAQLAVCVFNTKTGKLFYYFNQLPDAKGKNFGALALVDKNDNGQPTQLFFAGNHPNTYGICNLFSDDMSIVVFNSAIWQEVMEKEDYCFRFPYESIFKLFPEHIGRSIGTKPYADQAYAYAELFTDSE